MVRREDPTEIDDQTILDSRFGAGDAETHFAEMGFPAGRPRRRMWKPVAIILAVIMGGVVLHFSALEDEDHARRIRLQRDESERQLLQHLEKGDLQDLRQDLLQLGPHHAYQALSPWLDRLERSDQALHRGEWDLAYALLQEMPPVPNDLTHIAREMSDHKIRHLRLLLREQRLWHEVDSDNLGDLLRFVVDLPEDSLYRKRAFERIESLRRERWTRYESQLESRFVENNWDGVEALVANALAEDPDFPAESWRERLHEARHWVDLLISVRENLLAGRFLLASRLLPPEFADNPHGLALKELAQGLQNLDAEVSHLQKAFNFFQQADFRAGLALLRGRDGSNSVIALLLSHWEGVSQLWQRYRQAPAKTLEERLDYVKLCRELLSRLPFDEGTLRDEINVSLGVVTQDLEDYTRATERRLEEAWAGSDFTQAWHHAHSLLLIRPGDPRALETRARLNRVAARLADEIYILRDLDRSLAEARYQDLKSLVPPSHPELKFAEDLLQRP